MHVKDKGTMSWTGWYLEKNLAMFIKFIVCNPCILNLSWYRRHPYLFMLF